ncbi:MAG: Spi family protease inhibitor [Psychroflexus sp.]|nr:Spi family protease inhibitor [Psychroflexus sp.]MBS3742523.1 Spi family protease inhibitor [Candidatus Cloacimonadota bacterium]
MKKYYLTTILLLIVFISSLSASFVVEERATKIANNWYHQISKKSFQEFNISEVLRREFNDNLSYYIFKYEPVGFVIVSAEDATTPVLGYSSVSEFRQDIHNPALNEWML